MNTDKEKIKELEKLLRAGAKTITALKLQVLQLETKLKGGIK